MAEKIRVAILGQGRSGRDIHGACLSKHEKYELAAIADVDEYRRARAKAEYGCETVEDYRVFLERNDIDLIVNALPSHFHVPVTLEFLRKGKSVLCEKPAAATAAEVDNLLLTAKSTNAGLYFFQNSRFANWFTQTREVLASGVLGRIVEIKLRYSSFGRRWDWQTLQCNNGGSLRNTGPHPMDQAVVLMNNPAMPEIFCHFDRVNTWGDAEDFVKVIMRVPRGPVVDLEISSCDCFPGPTLSIQAQYGSLRADRGSVTWRYFNPKTAPPQKLTRTPIEKPDGTPSYCVEKLEWTEKTAGAEDGAPAIGAQPPDAPTETLYSKLYAHIKEGAEYEITGEQVRQQIAIMEKCHQMYPLTRLTE